MVCVDHWIVMRVDNERVALTMRPPKQVAFKALSHFGGRMILPRLRRYAVWLSGRRVPKTAREK
jgi:hypothetical protein